MAESWLAALAGAARGYEKAVRFKEEQRRAKTSEELAKRRVALSEKSQAEQAKLIAAQIAHMSAQEALDWATLNQRSIESARDYALNRFNAELNWYGIEIDKKLREDMLRNQFNIAVLSQQGAYQRALLGEWGANWRTMYGPYYQAGARIYEQQQAIPIEAWATKMFGAAQTKADIERIDMLLDYLRQESPETFEAIKRGYLALPGITLSPLQTPATAGATAQAQAAGQLTGTLETSKKFGIPVGAAPARGVRAGGGRSRSRSAGRTTPAPSTGGKALSSWAANVLVNKFGYDTVRQAMAATMSKGRPVTEENVMKEITYMQLQQKRGAQAAQSGQPQATIRRPPKRLPSGILADALWGIRALLSRPAASPSDIGTVISAYGTRQR